MQLSLVAEKNYRLLIIWRATMQQKQSDSKLLSTHDSITRDEQKQDVEKKLKAAMEFHNHGDLANAQLNYQHVLQIDKNNPVAMHLLGAVAMQVGRPDIAEPLIRKAITLAPDLDEAHNNLATLLEGLGRFEESIKHYQRALEIKPGVAMVHFNLASILRRIGRRTDAILHYKKTIEITPSYAAAYRQLISVKKYSEYDKNMQVMEVLIGKTDTSDNDKIHFAFGLGKAYEDLQEYEKSFEFIQQGNLLKHQSVNFDICNWDKQVADLKMVMNKHFFEKHDKVGSDDNTPIFILGMPRSGTSLVEQILASHPDVFGAGEVHTLNQVIGSYFNMNELLQTIDETESGVFAKLGELYVSAMRNNAMQQSVSGTRFITDKMPGNFKMIGLIKLLLPNAKIIHCRRNPMDNCFSLFKNYFSKGHVYAYDQVELGGYYNRYLKLMRHWHEVLPGFIFDINYEAVVADQEGQTRKLLEYCDLKWDPACLKFYQTKRAVKTISATQVRRPIYKDSVHLWKKYQKQLASLAKSLSDG